MLARHVSNPRVLVDDHKALVRIIGPKDAYCILSTRDVRRVGDDWPEH